MESLSLTILLLVSSSSEETMSALWADSIESVPPVPHNPSPFAPGSLYAKRLEGVFNWEEAKSKELGPTSKQYEANLSTLPERLTPEIRPLSSQYSNTTNAPPLFLPSGGAPVRRGSTGSDKVSPSPVREVEENSLTDNGHGPGKSKSLFPSPTPMFDGYYEPPGMIWRDNIDGLEEGIKKKSIQLDSQDKMEKGGKKGGKDDSQASETAIEMAKVKKDSSSSSSKEGEGAGDSSQLNRQTNLLIDDPNMMGHVIDKITVRQFLQRRIDTGRLQRTTVSPVPALATVVSQHRDYLLVCTLTAACVMILAAGLAGSQASSFSVSTWQPYAITEIVLAVLSLIGLILLIIVLFLRSAKPRLAVFLLLFSLVLWCTSIGLSISRLTLDTSTMVIAGIVLGGISGLLITTAIWIIASVVAQPMNKNTASLASHSSTATPSSSSSSSSSSTLPNLLTSVPSASYSSLPLASLDMELALRELNRLELENEQQRAQLQLDEMRLLTCQQPLKQEIINIKAELRQALQANAQLQHQIHHVQNQQYATTLFSPVSSVPLVPPSSITSSDLSDDSLSKDKAILKLKDELETSKKNAERYHRRADAAIDVLRQQVSELDNALTEEKKEHELTRMKLNTMTERALGYGQAQRKAAEDAAAIGGESFWREKYLKLSEERSDYDALKKENGMLREEIKRLNDEVMTQVAKREEVNRMAGEHLRQLEFATASITRTAKTISGRHPPP